VGKAGAQGTEILISAMGSATLDTSKAIRGKAAQAVKRLTLDCEGFRSIDTPVAVSLNP
jgi:hypothetical protein